MISDNIGTTDRMVRIIAAVLLLILFFISQISPTTAIVLLVIAVYLIVTGVLSYDPVYQLFGMGARGK